MHKKQSKAIRKQRELEFVASWLLNHDEELKKKADKWYDRDYGYPPEVMMMAEKKALQLPKEKFNEILKKNPYKQRVEWKVEK